MKYEILGGGHIEGATELELVEALRADGQAWLPSVSIEDFMEGMAARCKTQTGATICTLDTTSFLMDLIANKFLIPA